MLLVDLVATSESVTAVSGRLEKIARLADLLARVPPDEIDIAVPFLTGDTRQGRLGVGPAAISSAASAEPAGEPTLTLRDVDTGFARVASASGGGSPASRVELLRGLLSRATADEQRFLVRLLHGELRQGALEGVLVEAIAKAAGVAASTIRRAVMLSGNIAAVAHAVLTGGGSALGAFSVQLMRPLQPMLADSAEHVAAALADMGEAAFEYKLDGARIQVHKAEDEVKVFSRQLRDVTSAVPEVVEVVRVLPARELILDGEVIALTSSGGPLPFQTTMRRFGRRLDVDRLRQEVPLTPFFFDLVYRDGTPLLDESRRRRFSELSDVLPASAVVPHLVASDLAAAEGFYRDALARGHEGVMAKALDAPYVAGARGSAWLKIKHATTLDLVVLAAEWGNGRRQGWLSNLHLGARDPGPNGFVMLGKTFKGLTDQMLEWQTQEFLKREIGRDHWTVYVRPEIVVEIAFNDLQESPRYPGGLALRFARVKRYRPDKPASEADTFATVQEMFTRATGKQAPRRR